MKVGSLVFIKSFKRNGTILQVVSEQKAQVQLGGLSIWLPLDDLELIENDNSKVEIKTKKSTRSYTISSNSSYKLSRFDKNADTIDLHGATVDEAIDALETKISNAIINKTGRIKVIHGFGSGKVQDAVHNYLKNCNLILNFKIDDFNPGQTWVWL
jgi:DNA mismatch repair protein MutS2